MNKELEPLGGVDVPSLTDFWLWVREVFSKLTMSEIEVYLSQSTDHADLEHRVYTLQRKGLL